MFQVVLDPVTLEVSVVPTSRCNSTDRFHGKQIMPFLKHACARFCGVKWPASNSGSALALQRCVFRENRTIVLTFIAR